MNEKRGMDVSPVRVLVASGLLAVGSLAPWEVGATFTELGVEGIGICTLLLAVITSLIAIPRNPWPTVVLVIGAVSVVITGGTVIDIAVSMREPVDLEPPVVEIGWGLWVCLLASFGLVWSSWSFRREVRGSSGRSFDPPSQRDVWIRRNPDAFGLLVLLAIGFVLRLVLTISWRPAFTGYSDSGIYFQGAFESVWADPIRMVGYSMFLKVLNVLNPHLTTVVIVQHLLGLAAAALIFFAVRRCGGPRWLGLVPAGVLALGGDQIFIEHAALSEAPFTFLVVASLYAAVRAIDDRLWWTVLAGLASGLAVWGRTAGLGLAVILAIWLVFSAGRPTRRTLISGALCLVVALATIAVYAGWRNVATDQPGVLTSSNAWNLYGRVASWADCREFDPPPGTEELCEATPLAERGLRSGEEYIFGDSPATRLFGPPYRLSSDPTAMDRLQEWSQAALMGQPLEYLRAVLLDTRRLFSPNAPSYGQLSADGLVAFTLYGPERSGSNEFVESWQRLLYPEDPPPRRAGIDYLLTWQALTRIVGFWMAAALVLSLAGPVVLRGRSQAGAALFASVALLLLMFPIVSKSYDYRFVIPALAPLIAAATLGAWGLWGTLTRKPPRPSGSDHEFAWFDAGRTARSD